MNDLILTEMLMLVSLIVTVGLAKKRNMWPFIVAYWIILFTKNMMNLIAAI